MLRFALSELLCLGSAASALSSGDIGWVWNEENLAEIWLNFPPPPVYARNLFSVSAAMYDAWKAYDPEAVGRIGTNGQAQTKTFPAEARVSRAAQKMICEKLKRGYKEV